MDPVPGEPPPPGRKRRPRWVRVTGWSIVVILGLLITSVVAASTITVPYYAIEPGRARQVNDLLTVPPDRANPPQGDFLLVTVSVEKLTALGWLQSRRDPDDEVLSAEAYLGNQSDRQVTQQARQEMVDSQTFAAVAALRRLGHPVAESGQGATLQQVEQGTPAAARLAVGDLVTRANGAAVETAQQLRTVIQQLRPGDALTLEVTGADPSASPRTETITLGARPEPDQQGVAFLGVVFVTHQQRFDMPFDVGIDSGRIGGPSAGLAFTLGLIDQLSPGELTGGKKVAATGTINTGGAVGPIGGAYQKTVAVLREDADLFLVPADPRDYCPALARSQGRVKIVPVRTLEDAIEAVRAIGGDTSTLPPPPATLPQSTEPITDCVAGPASAAGR